MSMNCIVQGCRSSGDNGFFSLPKVEKVRRIWIEKLKMSEWFITTKKKYRVCFRHFSNDTFKTSGKKVTLKKGTFVRRYI